jgi:antitoxin component YwqK of YwqJK toxin-antitoxin module
LALKITYKDGKYHGLYEEYYYGQLEEKGTYKYGHIHGLYERYYENGQLKEKGTYDNGYKVD